MIHYLWPGMTYERERQKQHTLSTHGFHIENHVPY